MPSTPDSFELISQSTLAKHVVDGIDQQQQEQQQQLLHNAPGWQADRALTHLDALFHVLSACMLGEFVVHARFACFP